MMRDGDRIDHMLSFTRRCIEVLDGVDKAQFLDSVDKQESLELIFCISAKPPPAFPKRLNLRTRKFLGTR